MDNEVYSFALKIALNEIQNMCPDIKSTFIFKEDGEIVATDEKTPENTVIKVLNAFDRMFEKSDTIGDIEAITFENGKGRVSVSCISDLYFVTVTSEKTDMNYVNTVTRVLLPTVFKLLEKINPAPLKNNTISSMGPETRPEFQVFDKNERSALGKEEHAAEEPREPAFEPETNPNLLPEPTASQFIVENIGGLLVPSDTVRIDKELILQWAEVCEGKKIEEVEIETFGGKTTRCKIKPIKDSKYEGKGIVQMPEKIQFTLEIKKGELVKLKPVVE